MNPSRCSSSCIRYCRGTTVLPSVRRLEGTAGVQKMSKPYGNYVGIAEPAEEMFGKLMSVPDHLIIRYWTLLTDAEPEELETVQEGLTAGDYHPATAKRDL